MFTTADLDAAIRRVPDFPKSGICFYDITSILVNPPALAFCIEQLLADLRARGADRICAIESRGFIFASILAHQAGLPLILARKKGKLPNSCLCAAYDLEYGRDSICIQDCDLDPGGRYYVVDDLVATGGTLAAALGLLTGCAATIAGIGAVIGLPFLGYPRALAGHSLRVLLEYHSE